jgi:RHS repeat-associated protein
MPGRNYSVGEKGYRFGFNGKEKDDEVKGEGNSYSFTNRISDSRLGIYLSPDKLATKYPMNSPYSLMANNPILFIDQDGNENVIYLVLADNSISPQQAKEIAAKATENYKSMGVKTEVVFFAGKFDATKYIALHSTDAVAVVGNTKSVAEKISTFNKEHGAFVSDTKVFGEKSIDKTKKSTPTPEVSEFRGNTIAVSTSCLSSFIKGTDLSLVEVAAYSINHGRGHNSLMNHSGDAQKYGPNQQIYDGSLNMPPSPNLMHYSVPNSKAEMKEAIKSPNNNSNDPSLLNITKTLNNKGENLTPNATLINTPKKGGGGGCGRNGNCPIQID